MKRIDRPASPFDNPVLKGGQGSGNFAHSGRPGERGGSAQGAGVAGQATSMLDAQKFARTLGTSILAPGGTGGDQFLHIANRINSVAADLHARGARMPQAFLISTDPFQGKMAKTVPAAYSASADVIAINPRGAEWSQDITQVAAFAKLQKQMESIGWWSTGAPEHALRHEIGHVNHRHGDSEMFVQSGGVGKGYGDLTPEAKAIAGKVSDYGASKGCEFIAETYAGLAAGKTYDRDVMSLYKELGGPRLKPRKR